MIRPLAPTCVGVSPDGKFAVAGHAAFVSFVDLAAGTVVKTWPVSADAVDVIVSDPMTVSAGGRGPLPLDPGCPAVTYRG